MSSRRENPADAGEAPLPHRARRRIPTTATIGLAVAALGIGGLVVAPAVAAPAAAAADAPVLPG